MSTSKKVSKKRRRKSPTNLSSLAQISKRLEKVRSAQRNLWDNNEDDNDDADGQIVNTADNDNDSNNNNIEPAEKTKKSSATSNKTYIVLSDSDDELLTSSRRRGKKKHSRTSTENHQSDTERKKRSKCPTCLICSILSTLSSYNCCSRHLSLLLNVNNHSDDNHERSMKPNNSNSNSQWPPQQVMIVPMTDELIQRYLNSEQIYHLKGHESTSSTEKRKSTDSARSNRKLSKRSQITFESPNIEQSKKSSRKASHTESNPTVPTESTTINSGTIPSDTTFTIVQSTSTTINSFESPTVLDTCQLQQSSDQPIIIDDSQTENQQGDSSNHVTNKSKQDNPWTPIEDETDSAIEAAINQYEQESEEPIEFTPATARRIPAEVMASRLPKIQLKKGRFRQGKPINDKTTTETITNQSSSSSTTTTTTPTVTNTANTRSAPALATIVEDESLIISSTRITSDKSSHILSERHENTTEGLSDTIMSCLFAQDESSQHDHIHLATKTITNELIPPTIIVEDYSRKDNANNSLNMSQSSQMTNDQIDTQPTVPAIINEKTTTPSRISYRLNPDGSRISISRPVISANHQSPVIALRRVSTDVTLVTHDANK